MRLGSPTWAAVVGVLVACTPEPKVVTPDPPDAATSAVPLPTDPPDAATANPKDTRPLFVREVRVDCEGEGPQKCLQIRASASDPWLLHYGSIEGFHYEDGYAYELKVVVETITRPPADATSHRYRLVEVVSKTKVP